MPRAPEHGAPPPGLAEPDGPGRYGRMFPGLPACPAGDDLLETLVGRVEDGLNSDPNHDIPAGYTYLGQFVDHDLTFDPTSRLGRANDVDALANFRTPRLDLDSVYGSGPADQPYLYEATPGRDRGVKLLIGRPNDRDLAAEDLPRNAQGVALVGDPRNDENLITAQLHLMVLRFHNRVVDRLRAADRRLGGAALFEAARRAVTWHYQWIVVHDFLGRILGEDAAAAARHRATTRTSPAAPRIPVEFSGAVYRFGHSMVRNDYDLNDAALHVPIMPDPGAEHEPHLRGFRPLPAGLVIDWDRFFFDTPGDGRNPSMRIDHRLSRRLRRVPPDGEDLARLNLRRGRALGLPAGPTVAQALAAAPVASTDLQAGDLGDDDCAAVPLWFYVLCEAGSEALGGGGKHLGPVGARIVGDVLCGMVADDPAAYLRSYPDWEPDLGDAPGDFTMRDLVRFTRD